MRRKAKQEAEKREKQKAEEQRKEQQKAKAAADAEADGPREEELVPTKLQKPENALREAIAFLQPLQRLSSTRVRTHTLAFEIYYRKGSFMSLFVIGALFYELTCDCR